MKKKLLDKFNYTLSRIEQDLKYNQQLNPDKTIIQLQKNYRLSINLPHIRKIMQIFNQLDEVAILIDSNYQSGNFSLKDKKRKEYQLQQFVLKLTHYSRDISNRVISLKN